MRTMRRLRAAIRSFWLIWRDYNEGLRMFWMTRNKPFPDGPLTPIESVLVTYQGGDEELFVAGEHNIKGEH